MPPSPLRRFVSLLLPLALVLAGLSAHDAGAAGSRHPYFDDRGTLPWYGSLREAQAAARREGKLILIEFGRKRCSNCRTLAERVLPDARLRGRLRRGVVGLASDCDRPERAVRQLFRAHLAGARSLPFVALLTSDGRWITGWAGAADVQQVSMRLDMAAAHVRLERSVAKARHPAVIVPVRRDAPPQRVRPRMALPRTLKAQVPPHRARLAPTPVAGAAGAVRTPASKPERAATEAAPACEDEHGDVDLDCSGDGCTPPDLGAMDLSCALDARPATKPVPRKPARPITVARRMQGTIEIIQITPVLPAPRTGTKPTAVARPAPVVPPFAAFPPPNPRAGPAD